MELILELIQAFFTTAIMLAIYRADNENENIPRLIEWILSDEGQTLIEETGYVRIK